MAELMTNSLRVKEMPSVVNAIQTNIQYPQLNQLLGPYHNICYHLHGGRLYFLGDQDQVSTVLDGHGFKQSRVEEIALDIDVNWEIIRTILYKGLKFFFLNQKTMWKPTMRNEVFFLQPRDFQGTLLVHEFYNSSGEQLVIYEGFRYYLEFIGRDLVLTLLPKVKPVFPVKGEHTWQPVVRAKGMTFIETRSDMLRRKGFFPQFRRVAVKENWKKRALLNTFLSLLKGDGDEFIIPVGNIERGLVLEPCFLTIVEGEEDFYAE